MDPFLSSQNELCRFNIGFKIGFSQDELLRCNIWFLIWVFLMWILKSLTSDFSRLSIGLCCKSLSHSDFCRETLELFVLDRNKSRTAFFMNDGFLESFFLVFGEKDSSRSTLEFMASDELRKPTTKYPLSYGTTIWNVSDNSTFIHRYLFKFDCILLYS